jgi:excinuclease UvrABC nuclease subunit
MAERQLNLFPTRNSLCERFDADFFRAIPREPGVYFMSDAAGRVLYVGKARDLRQRLGSYRYAHEHCSRKTARLTGQVCQIRWQVCSSEEAALLEENRLLRELRPRFNRANTWPRAARFIRIDLHPGVLGLALTGEADGDSYGAFKGASRENFGALLRLVWTAMHSAGYAELPRALLLERCLAAYQWLHAGGGSWRNRLRGFLLGESTELLDELQAQATEGTPFHLAFRQADLESLHHFFRVGPQRNHFLRQRFGDGQPLIPQEELDDWIVRGRALQSPAGNAKAT